jgi:hypothetical protein
MTNLHASACKFFFARGGKPCQVIRTPLEDDADGPVAACGLVPQESSEKRMEQKSRASGAADGNGGFQATSIIAVNHLRLMEVPFVPDTVFALRAY